jgi:hypothetical protein
MQGTESHFQWADYCGVPVPIDQVQLSLVYGVGENAYGQNHAGGGCCPRALPAQSLRCTDGTVMNARPEG